MNGKEKDERERKRKTEKKKEIMKYGRNKE
jgi:hypothetical protein